MTIETINPATGEKLKSYAKTPATEVEPLMRGADNAFASGDELRLPSAGSE